MKLLLAILALPLLFVILFIRPSGQPKHFDLDLPTGRTNPPLRKLDTTKIPPRARLWIHTNRTHFATVLAIDPTHPFPGQTEPGALLQDINGEDDWIPLRSLKNTFTEE